MRLTVAESPDLEGTSKVVIEAPDDVVAEFGGEGLKDGPRTVRLHHGAQECGALVREVRPGDGRVLLDKHLRLGLRVRVDEQVDVEAAVFADAEEVALDVPPTWLTEEAEQLLRSRLNGRPVSRGTSIPVYTFVGTMKLVAVAETRPEGIVLLGPRTRLTMNPCEEPGEAGTVTYRDVGGLEREISRIRELVEYPLRSPDLFAYLGIEVPKGVILYGPPGTGKTLIAKALSTEVGARFYSIQGPEIISALVGESERKLREVFEAARENAPSVILIDELDSLAPKRDQMRGEMESRLVATLLTLMDGLVRLKDVVVVGTTNRIDAIDPALRRPGRFEHEIHVGVPSVAGRTQILGIHARGMPLEDGLDLELVADKTVGFTGADLGSLCREAGYCALRRSYSAESLEKGEVFADESIRVSAEDFQTALGSIQPSALREVMVQVPRDVSWSDIGGLEDVKQLITENVIYGIRKAAAFESVGIRPARGLLLYGPPGTGKTLLARAVANECEANFIVVRGPELRSKWFGESEEKIRFIFSKARETAPCVIFFDEMDALAPTRGRDASGLTDSLVNQLLAEMDGVESVDRVFVIAATNMPDLIDPALLRPGRFDYQIEVPLPDRDARESILRVHLANKPLTADVAIPELADSTGGFSGADLASACRLAGLAALRRVDFADAGAQVTGEDLRDAVTEVRTTRKKVKPTIGFRVEREEEE